MYRATPILFLAVLLAAAPAAIKISLAKEVPGRESKAFLSMVGNWIVVSDDNRNVMMADGRPWKRGQPAGGLADKVRQIYGSRNEAFIDNVQAIAYFPYAVAQEIPEFQNGEISMRFKLVEGQLDQFKNGKRSFVKKGAEDVPLELKKWYSMKIAVHGAELKGYLNGQLLIEYKLPEPVQGKVGLWSKTDSVAYFDDYTVTIE